MLEIDNLSVSFGRHQALHGVSLRVARGETVVILGANGAGKSTLLRAVSGQVSTSHDTRIRFDRVDIHVLPTHAIVETGLALVPEGRGIFGDLTVRENLILGAFARRARGAEERNRQRVLALFPRLAERLNQQARTMSGGEQRMIAIGRALMSDPAMLLLDEPSLGLSPILCQELFTALSRLRDAQMGLLLVEQNARRGLAISDRGYVLSNGQIVKEGRAGQLGADPAIVNAYLGGVRAAT